MARPAKVRANYPIDIVDDGLTDAEIADKVADWLADLRNSPAIELPTSGAEELAAARRDGDL